MPLELHSLVPRVSTGWTGIPVEFKSHQQTFLRMHLHDIIEQMRLKNKARPEKCHLFQHVAALVNRHGVIVASATNEHTLHAEIAVIRKWKRKYRKWAVNQLTMIVLRFSISEYRLATSRPCQQCQKHLRETYPGIRKVFYSVGSQDFLLCERFR